MAHSTAKTQNSQKQEAETLAVFENHADAFLRGDINGVMEDFDTHSIIITPDGVFHGLTSIRTLYSTLLNEFGSVYNGDSTFELDNKHVKGNLLWAQWHAETPNNYYSFATDTFLIEDDIIHRQTITPIVKAKEKYTG